MSAIDCVEFENEADSKDNFVANFDEDNKVDDNDNADDEERGNVVTAVSDTCEQREQGDYEDFAAFQSSPTHSEKMHEKQQPLHQQEEDQQQEFSNHLEVVVGINQVFKDIFRADNGAITDDSQLLEYDEESLHPLSERWSPVGANYDDALTPNSELMSPESELELLSSDSGLDKQAMMVDGSDPSELARLRNIEDEQELLTSSLMALTSHFAHVQLRVRQIVEAPSHERDQLLKDLEEFAFQGIPEPVSASAISGHDNDEMTQQRQFELIEHLKAQLSELEKIAYESGAPVLPQHILVEKQKMIIDELKNRLNLKVEDHDLAKLSSENLKTQVDQAIGEFVGPLKMKEKLVAQLKTQITDLERFIAYLQYDADDAKMKNFNGNGSEKFSQAYNSYAAKKKGASARSKQKPPPTIVEEETNAVSTLSEPQGASVRRTSTSEEPNSARESLQSKAHGLMDKASLLMQMFATTHFGSKAEHFQKNTLKKTAKGNHWGDLRAQLEVDIQEVASLAATLSFDREKLAAMKRALKKTHQQAAAKTAVSTVADGLSGALTVPPRGRSQAAQAKQLKAAYVSSDSDEDAYDCYDWEQKSRRAERHGGDSINTISRELTTAIRKNFAMTLLRLIQHGLRVETESATSSLIVPFMRCLHPSPVFAAEHSARAATFMSGSSTLAATYGAYDDFDETDSAASSSGSRQMHAWELILEYYYLKNGEEYNNTPARKLSQSFNLDIVDAQVVTPKQNLLSVVGQIIAMHRPYKRSFNAHFKAFVCAGLNARQLVDWLNLIVSCNDLIDAYYTPNSYVVRTGFRDSLRSIDALSKYEFDLPVDLAVRHFRNI